MRRKVCLEVKIHDRQRSAVAGPAVGAGHVLDAAVLGVLVLQCEVDGEVLHRGGAGPVGVVLVPGHPAPRPGRLAEQLVINTWNIGNTR